MVKLDFFAKARDAGMSIADLRDLMEAIADNGDPAVAQRIVRAKIDELKERAAQIRRVVAFLGQAIDGG